MKVLRATLETGGLCVPSDRYYLADSRYVNSTSFLCPYRNHNYNLINFDLLPRNNRHRSAKNLFNHRHAQLCNVVERTFGGFKKRFKILTVMTPYKYKKQCHIVITCCILHNFIKIQNELQNDNDALLNREEDENENLNDDQSKQSEVDDTYGGGMLRTILADALWVYRQNQRRRNLNVN
jgi:DDE superfamily endonuclease